MKLVPCSQKLNTIVLLRYPPQEISSHILRNCLMNYPQKLSSEIIFRKYPQKFPQKLSSQTPSDILLRNPKHSNSLPNSYQEIYSLFFSKKHRLHIPAQNIHPPSGSSINVIASILKLFDPPSSPLGATSS